MSFPSLLSLVSLSSARQGAHAFSAAQASGAPPLGGLIQRPSGHSHVTGVSAVADTAGLGQGSTTIVFDGRPWFSAPTLAAIGDLHHGAAGLAGQAGEQSWQISRGRHCRKDTGGPGFLPAPSAGRVLATGSQAGLPAGPEPFRFPEVLLRARREPSPAKPPGSRSVPEASIPYLRESSLDSVWPQSPAKQLS